MTLSTTLADAVGTITLNRPDQGNSIDIPTANALLDAVVSMAENESVRAVVLTGKGRFFCLGGDIQAFADPDSDAATVIARITAPLHAAIGRLASMNKPLLTAINGTAAGAGLGLALLGDLAIARKSASFTSAYTAIGMSPDASTSWLLPRLVGLRRAQELVLTNRKVGAEEATAMGMITETVEDDAFDDRIAEAASMLAKMASPSAGNARRLLLQSLDNSLREQLELEASSIIDCARSDEGRAGIEAFLKK